MKRILSIVLVAVFALSALYSCAPAKPQYDESITLASSDAAECATWLDNRLEEIPDEVILGIGSSQYYGIDMSTFKADGYIVRNIGGEVVLFGASKDGLDRAVRVYAKAAEKGMTADLDKVYHEDERIDSLTIAGRDISEYTIYCENNGRLKIAAKDLASKIFEACGVTPEVSHNEPTAPYIVLKFVSDDSLNTCGWRYSVTEDGLTLEFSDGYKFSSASVGMTRFLETKLGCFGLTFGYEDFDEFDSLSFNVGESGGETNAFRYAQSYGDNYSVNRDVIQHNLYDYSGVVSCCHGLQAYGFAGDLSSSSNQAWSQDQPCYLSEEFYELSLEDVDRYIESKLNGGLQIGWDLNSVDIGNGDNSKWCVCKDCKKMLKKEGSESGSIITWANRLTDALSEKYPGLVYCLFTNNDAPKTVVPNECLYFTFGFGMGCDIHPFNSLDCTGDAPLSSNLANRTSVTLAAQFNDWLDLTSNVYIWFYGMDQGLATLSYVDTMRENMRYFASKNAKGFFWQAEDTGFSTGKVAKWMASAMTWNIDMTDEEYDAYVDRVLRAMYGEGAGYVKDYIVDLELVQRAGPCAHCWLGAYNTPTLMLSFMKEHFDDQLALMEAAVRNVDTAKQESRAKKLACACIYKGCAASYFDAYAAYDDERIAELSRRYALIGECFVELGIDPNKNAAWFGGVGMYHVDFESDLEVMAWKVWADNCERLYLTLPERPMPDRIADILSSEQTD